MVERRCRRHMVARRDLELCLDEGLIGEGRPSRRTYNRLHLALTTNVRMWQDICVSGGGWRNADGGHEEEEWKRPGSPDAHATSPDSLRDSGEWDDIGLSEGDWEGSIQAWQMWAENEIRYGEGLLGLLISYVGNIEVPGYSVTRYTLNRDVGYLRHALRR